MPPTYDDYLAAFWVSLVVSTVSMTLSKAKLFRGLREAVSQRSRWLGELIHCPYCVSHWISFLLVAVYRPCLTHCCIPVADYVVSAFAMVAMATIWSRSIGASLLAMDLLHDTDNVARH